MYSTPVIAPVPVGTSMLVMSRQILCPGLDEFSAASFEHWGQNNRNFEGFGHLGETNHVVHDHRRLVTVKVCELKRLVIDQDNDAFLWGQ